MKKETKQKIESQVEEKLTTVRPVSGSSSDAYFLMTQSQKTLFAKVKPAAKDAFEKEAFGIRALRQTREIRLPSVIAVDTSFLLLEWIDTASPGPGFWSAFGKSLARLHQNKSEFFGFEHNNYLGKAPQKNTPEMEVENAGENWADFYIRYRLDFQIAWAAGQGYDLMDMYENFKPKIVAALSKSLEIPSLLHGDLWKGNYLCDKNNQPILIDPACSYGHRELDIAMTHLFGGFPKEFYDAYNYEYPLQSGWQSRLPIYKLYHVLNHLNLFGGGYLAQARSMMI